LKIPRKRKRGGKDRGRDRLFDRVAKQRIRKGGGKKKGKRKGGRLVGAKRARKSEFVFVIRASREKERGRRDSRAGSLFLRRTTRLHVRKGGGGKKGGEREDRPNSDPGMKLFPTYPST